MYTHTHHITSHHITTQGNASQHGAVRTIIHSRCTLRTRGGVSNKSDKNKTPAALFHPPYPIGLCHNVTANLGRKNPHTFAAQLRLASAPPMLGRSGRCAVQKNHVILIALKGAAQAMMCLGDPCKGVRIILSGGVRGETQQSLSLARYRGAMRRLAFAAQVFASIRSARLRWILATRLTPFEVGQIFALCREGFSHRDVAARVTRKRPADLV